jgi:cytochrome c oxidase cbb3-type subunit III
MKPTTRVLTTLVIGFVTSGLVRSVALNAQNAPPAQGAPPAQAAPPAPRPPIKNPYEGKAEAIQAGSASFTTQCASCHGSDAKGTARASDLTRLWAEGQTDVQVFRTIRAGIANSLLPHSFGPDTKAWEVLAYVQSINVPPGSAVASGNAELGASIFEAKCRTCHQVDGQGGRLGPALSHIGADRSRTMTAYKIRHASSYIMVDFNGIENNYIVDGYQPVTLVTKDGQRIRGAKKNEDAFSVQIMDTNERIQGYVKANLREVVNDTASLMPDFGPDTLNDRDLQDLLAYLGTLRGPATPGR